MEKSKKKVKAGKVSKQRVRSNQKNENYGKSIGGSTSSDSDLNKRKD